MSGPATILDGSGSGSKTVGFQTLLQRIPGSRVAEGSNSDTNTRSERCELQIVPLAKTLFYTKRQWLHEHEFTMHKYQKRKLRKIWPKSCPVQAFDRVVLLLAGSREYLNHQDRLTTRAEETQG
jgi:hypothetical protein